jgi:hypothetical protein
VTPAAEEELLRYLREQREADMAGMLRRLHNEFLEHDKRDTERHAELRADMRGVSMRVGRLEHDAKDLEEEITDHGRRSYADLEKQLAEEKGNGKWLRRNWIPLVAAVFSVFTGAAALVVAILALMHGAK